MLYVDIPTPADLKALRSHRDDMCVSIYLPTTPVTQEATRDAQAARAATYGAVQIMLMDIDELVPGKVDETDGSVTFAERASADSYGVVDEIASRVIMSGGRVLAVRKADIPRGQSLAAILRYPM